MKRRWPWLVFAALVLLALAAAFIWRGQPVEVSTARARIGPAAEMIYATGYVEARQSVSVQSRITAPVERILVNEGDRVTRGQPLILLADDEQQALLAQSAAQRRAAEQAEYRTTTLFAQGWVTRAARDSAVANADTARAAEATANARRDQLVVRALIDGVVTKRDIEPGELATPTRVLAQLGDPASLRITATVDERDIARVRPGQQALMSSDAWPGRTIAATVAEITPSGDPAQRAFRVRLHPASAADLPLGLTLEVNIVARRVERAVLVPAAAYANGKVWVVARGRAGERSVKAGIVGAENVEIVSGIAAGDTVILTPPASLTAGQRVKEKR